MAEQVKQIKIGIIDLEKDSLEIITKVKTMLEKAIQESKSVENTAPLSETILQTATQMILQILDTANEEMKTEKAQKTFVEGAKNSGYKVSEIQSAIKLAKNAVESLPTSSYEFLKLISDDIKKIMVSGIPISK